MKLTVTLYLRPASRGSTCAEYALLENDTFFAHLNIEQTGSEGTVEQILRIDSRPSDGIAIAVRTKCPIYVAEPVMDTAAQDMAILSPEDEPEEDLDL